MTRVTAFDHWFTVANKAILVFLMSAMTVLVFGNVIGRYVFGVSFGWAEELSRFAMIWAAFLGVGLALRYGQLAAVEMLQFMMPEAGAHAMRVAVLAVIVAFLFALVVLGLQFTVFSWNLRTPVLQLPRGLPYLAVPLGAFFALIHLALSLRTFLSGNMLVLDEFEPDDTGSGSNLDADPLRATRPSDRSTAGDA